MAALLITWPIRDLAGLLFALLAVLAFGISLALHWWRQTARSVRELIAAALVALLVVLAWFASGRAVFGATVAEPPSHVLLSCEGAIPVVSWVQHNPAANYVQVMRNQPSDRVIGVALVEGRNGQRLGVRDTTVADWPQHPGDTYSIAEWTVGDVANPLTWRDFHYYTIGSMALPCGAHVFVPIAQRGKR